MTVIGCGDHGRRVAVATVRGLAAMRRPEGRRWTDAGPRYCEEQSDEAIQRSGGGHFWIASLRLLAPVIARSRATKQSRVRVKAIVCIASLRSQRRQEGRGGFRRPRR